MKRNSLCAVAFLVVVFVISQTASAQFPKLPKIPRPGQPKPQPTPTPAAQPAGAEDGQPAAQPSRPQNESRNAASATPSSGGPYAKRFVAPESPVLLPESLEISTDTQDFYWKMPKVSGYTSWYPHVKVQVAYGGEAKLRFKADYSMPDGSPWYSETLEQKWDGPFYLLESQWENDKDKGKSVVTPGMYGIKITNLRDNSVAFQGKFKVIKFKPETVSGPNGADFYVGYDWNLPIGYTNIDFDTPTSPLADPGIQMWFKGGVNTSDLEAQLFHNGKQIATTDEGGTVNSVERRFSKHAGNDPALTWQLLEFRWRKLVRFVVDEGGPYYSRPMDYIYINQMPGEYVVKVFYKGEQVRETKFSIADGDFAPNGVSLPNGLKTYRVLLPVRVMGNADKWNPATWKTDAFYGNPITGFAPPQ
ncbi:MAG: hypothetical protein ABI698_01375 [bacterium]